MTRSSAGAYIRAYIVPLLLLQFAAALPVAAQPLGVDVRTDLAYGPHPAQRADLYLPTGGPAGRRPTVVMIHGGGWVGGSRTANDGMARLIASQGLVVLNIDYRLADPARPDTRWPAQLVDAQLAVRFLRAHAAEWEVDPARVGATGDSAGGQLAVFLGTLPRIVAGDMAGLYPQERPDVSAVVDQYGVMDLATMGQGAASIQALFGTPTPPAAALATASPLGSVTSHTAPVYIVQGNADTIVPPDQSRHLRDALIAHGVEAKLIVYHGGHAYKGVANRRIETLQFDSVVWLIKQLR